MKPFRLLPMCVSIMEINKQITIVFVFFSHNIILYAYIYFFFINGVETKRCHTKYYFPWCSVIKMFFQMLVSPHNIPLIMGSSHQSSKVSVNQGKHFSRLNVGLQILISTQCSLSLNYSSCGPNDSVNNFFMFLFFAVVVMNALSVRLLGGR